MRPRLTPPQQLIIGILLGAIALHYAIRYFEYRLSIYTGQVAMWQMMEIKRQCDGDYHSTSLGGVWYNCTVQVDIKQ